MHNETRSSELNKANMACARRLCEKSRKNKTIKMRMIILADFDYTRKKIVFIVFGGSVNSADITGNDLSACVFTACVASTMSLDTEILTDLYARHRHTHTLINRTHRHTQIWQILWRRRRRKNQKWSFHGKMVVVRDLYREPCNKHWNLVFPLSFVNCEERRESVYS